MQRWHKLRHGRIVASCECVTGDAAEVLLAPTPVELIVSDAQWRGTMYRRTLMRVGTATRGTEQRTADMKRRAHELSERI